jgi:hypothetical protein
VERTDQVLARRGVHAGLAADGRVDHAQQAGGYLHDAHPAQPARGDEAGEVGHRPTTDPDHGVGTGEPGGTQCVPAPGGHLDRLARLRVGYLQRQRPDPGVTERIGDPGREVLERRGVQHGDLGGTVHKGR